MPIGGAILPRKVGEDKAVTVGDTDEYVTMSTDEKITYGKREFFGSLRCQVISITQDFQSGMTVIDVRVTEPSKAIAEKVY